MPRTLTAPPSHSPREAILGEIQRRRTSEGDRKYSRYRLAKALEGELTPASVYSFLRANSETSSKHVVSMLKELDLVIVPRSMVPRSMVPRSMVPRS